MVLLESRRKLQYFTFDPRRHYLTAKSRQDVQNLYSRKQHLAGLFMADISTFKWILSREINQNKYVIRYARV